jgi:hypothetical protein
MTLDLRCGRQSARSFLRMIYPGCVLSENAHGFDVLIPDHSAGPHRMIPTPGHTAAIMVVVQ